MKKELEEKFSEMAALYNLELNENTGPFDCDICMEQNIPPHQGVVLKECLHVFCKYNFFLIKIIYFININKT